MRDIAQTVAQDAYAGSPKGMLVGFFILIVFLFVLWFREYVKKK